MIVIGEIRRKKGEPLRLEVHGQTPKAYDAFAKELRKLLKKHGYGGRLVSAVTPPRRQKGKRKR